MPGTENKRKRKADKIQAAGDANKKARTGYESAFYKYAPEPDLEEVNAKKRKADEEAHTPTSMQTKKIRTPCKDKADIPNPAPASKEVVKDEKIKAADETPVSPAAEEEIEGTDETPASPSAEEEDDDDTASFVLALEETDKIETKQHNDAHAKLYDGKLYSNYFGPVNLIDRSLSPEAYEEQAAKRSGSPYVDYDTFPELAPKQPLFR